MSGDWKNREIGAICGECDFDIFTWKIPNISSLPHEVDYCVQSPLFSYASASWILKMYPYGQTMYETEGYIDLIIERLESQVKDHYFRSRIWYENSFKKEYNPIRATYHFEPTYTQMKGCRFVQNLKECPERWQLAPKDIFTVIFGFEKNRNEADIQIEPDKTTVSEKYKVNENNKILETGEILKDIHFAFKYFVWKICMDRPKPFEFPEDYQVQSPPFDLAGATWILKLYPYFRMKHSRRPNCDVVLKRLRSEVLEHRIKIRMQLDVPVRKVVEGFFVINSYNTTGDVISFQWNEEDIPRLSCLHFEIDLCLKKYIEVELNSTKALEPCTSSMSISGSKAVLQNFRKLYMQQEDCDVVFKVKEKKFHAHSLILKAQCPVLASAFRIDMKERATGILDIEDCEPSVFSDFLQYLYCGEVEKLSDDNAIDLFKIADKYDVSGLTAMCIEFIKRNLSVNTFCDTITLALLHSEAELVELSTDFFAKNIQEIVVTVKWQSFVLENPIQGNELIIKALVPSQRDRES